MRRPLPFSSQIIMSGLLYGKPEVTSVATCLVPKDHNLFILAPIYTHGTSARLPFSFTNPVHSMN
jgi:hypothetical protein